MLALRDTGPPRPGDLLHHPRVGLLLVDRVGAAQVTGELVVSEGRRPFRVARTQLSQGWSLCPPGGFAEQAVTAPEVLRHTLKTNPAAGLRLLLDEVGGRIEGVDIRKWVLEMRVLPADGLDAWWATAREHAQQDPGLRVDGETVTSGADDDTVFEGPLALPPTARMAASRDLSAVERLLLLSQAAESHDGASARLLLRDLGDLPEPLAQRLAAVGIAGDSRLMASLLTRRDGPTIAVAALAALSLETRPTLANAIAAVPRSARSTAVLAVLEAALAGPGGEAAALWIGDVLADGGTAKTGDTGFPRARGWLLERTSEATLKHAPRPTARSLAHLRPLTARRLWPVSVALARALAGRHAEGQYGGVGGARLLPDGTIKLAPPEDTTPLDDVRHAMRLLSELSIGRPPPTERLTDDAILAHLPSLAPHIPTEWLAVLARSLAVDPTLRPQCGLDLWEQLAVGEASARVRAEAPRRPRSRLVVGVDTHIGRNKARISQTNQDAAFHISAGTLSLIVVADGISTSTAGSGDLASGLLIETFRRHWEASALRLPHADDADLFGFLDAALIEANDAICATSLRMAGGHLGRHIPMGTTVVAAIVRGERALIASLGDSRAYLVGASGAGSILGDQNLRGAWLQSWQAGDPIDLEGTGNPLVGYVGRFNETNKPEPHPPQRRAVTLLPGESLILCSDGLPDYATSSPAALAAMLEQAATLEDPYASARALVDHANAGGGGDNITVLVARLRST